MSIEAVIYSYKNKNLKHIVDSLVSNTSESIKITVFDQHPIDRFELFPKQIDYNHIIWDSQTSPCELKADILNQSSSDYFLIISDDTVLPSLWDKECKKFLNNKNIVLSGQGQLYLTQKDPFSIAQERSISVNYSKATFVDRNFIFAKTEILKKVSYPFTMKYFGEEELLSLNLYKQNIDIFSCPSNFYKDLNERTVENKYTTFSKEHNYNNFITDLKNAPFEFLVEHNIAKADLNELPYQTNDVSYDPYMLDFQQVDARKFIEDTKVIS